MRYVIVIVSVALFVGWEAIYGDWIITESIINEMMRVKARLGF